MSQVTADILLLLVTLVWGSTFVLVKNAIETMGPLTFLAVRFFIAGTVLLVWHAVRNRTNSKPIDENREIVGDTKRHSPNNRFYVGGVLAGLALGFSYAMQTLGLVTVPAGKAAFITGLYVVLVPIGAGLLLRTAPDLASVIGVSLATVGLALLSLQFPLSIAPGDFLVLMCGVGFAAHILLVGVYSNEGDPVLFTGIQLIVVALGTGLGALIFERPLFVPSSAWGAIIFTALAATSFAFLIQTAMQRYTSPTHTALIFSAEPVFGAVFAWLLTGETLKGREILGAVCILIGMLVSELRSIQKPSPVPSTSEDRAVDA
ncbi:MAG TPA: DMT family transporter [Firmicutes bacterium]|nr:DMT family transporter [Candidatus Fermentithermobacillaceae bacterium]